MCTRRESEWGRERENLWFNLHISPLSLSLSLCVWLFSLCSGTKSVCSFAMQILLFCPKAKMSQWILTSHIIISIIIIHHMVSNVFFTLGSLHGSGFLFWVCPLWDFESSQPCMQSGSHLWFNPEWAKCHNIYTTFFLECHGFHMFSLAYVLGSPIWALWALRLVNKYENMDAFMHSRITSRSNILWMSICRFF